MHFDNLGALNWLEEAIKEDKRIAKERKDLEEQNDALKQKVLEMVEEQAKMKTMHDKAITKNTRDTIDWMLDYHEHQEDELTYGAMKRRYEQRSDNPMTNLHDMEQILEDF